MNKFALFFAVILTISLEIRGSDTLGGCLYVCSNLGFGRLPWELPAVFGCFNEKEKRCRCETSCLNCWDGDICIYKLPDPYNPTEISFGLCTKEGKHCK